MGLIWIYIAYFALWLWVIYRKAGVNVSYYLIGVYLVSMICCEVLFIAWPDSIRYPERVTFTSVLFHIFLLVLVLLPLTRFGNSLTIDKVDINRRTLAVFSWCVVIPALAAMWVSLSDVGAMLGLYGDLSDARYAFMEGDVSNLYIERFGAWGYVMSMGTATSFLSIVLGFYYLFVLKKRGLLTVLLFLASFSLVVNNLAIAGREGVVRWILFFGFCCVLFRHHMSFRGHKIFWFLVVGGAAIIITAFLIISQDRFGHQGRGVLYSFFYYIGEQYYYFGYGLDRFGGDGMTGDILSPFQLFQSGKDDIFFLNERYYADYYLNTFPTFVGSFLVKMGAWRTTVLCVIIFVLLYAAFWKIRPGKKASFTRFVGYLMCYEIALAGVFYFLHGARITEFAMIVYVLLAYVLKQFEPRDAYAKLREAHAMTKTGSRF